MIYGYVRVSTGDQNYDRPMMAMKDYGVDQIFVDNKSGKDLDRPQYKKVVKKLKSDDIFVIKSIDRLRRNYIEIWEQWRIITKERQADIVIIDIDYDYA